MQITGLTTHRSALRNLPYPYLGIAALLVAGLVTSVMLHWNERLYFYLTHQTGFAAHDVANRSLSDYSAVVDAKPVRGIKQNLSAVSYDGDQIVYLPSSTADPPSW